MSILLLVHNRYQQAGGEDVEFQEESALLRRHGHEVVEWVEDNRSIEETGRFSVAVRSVWSSGTRSRLRDLIRRARPEIAHFHNTFPLISPSAYWACHEASVPVVQTLHNYRLLCAAATFFRSGRACEDCMGKRLLWPGLLHACYRSSRLETAGVTAMLQAHRILGTWQNKVDLFIAVSGFCRTKFLEGGLPPERVVVKPNFVYPDPGAGRADEDFVLFAGRLSAEKGIRLMLEAWRHLHGPPLTICGDGPMRELVDRFATSQAPGAVLVHGARSHQHVIDMMKQARFLVFPSLCYENFPMVIVEAFACGLPVVCADGGAAAEIVDNGRTGVHFRSGDARSLAEAVDGLWRRPAETRRMGAEARADFLSKYTGEANYQILMDLYARARRTRGAHQ